MKRLTTIAILVSMITLTGVFAYATINYIMSKTVEETIVVGSTVITEEGLSVTINTRDTNNLTYHTLPETDTSKWHITYTYDYEIYLECYDIQVSTVSSDIKITEIVYGDVIEITFQLNQESDFSSGDVVSVLFLFELVELTLNGYTASNPIDINNATVSELIDIGFTVQEANNVIAAGSSTPFDDLANLAMRIGAPTLVDRYSEYEIAGIIVFN